MSLLSPSDPAPFMVEHPDGASDFVFVCDHAGREIPAALGTLGLTEADLDRHIAWDIGIADTSRILADQLDAFLITQTYSRLVIDCNRPLTSPQSVTTLSERTHIPGNANLTRDAVQQRVRAIFEPYHNRIVDELDRRARSGRRTLLVCMHSFTPVYMDEPRSLHAGVLYNRDTRVAHAMLAQLSTEPGITVGDNAPYSASDATDYALVVHGEQRGLPCVELEVRQDLISDREGQREWAFRLAVALRSAHATLFPA